MSSLKLLAVNKHSPARKWRIGKHGHPFYEVIVLLRGAEYIKYNNETSRVAAGDMLFLAPGMFHEEWSDPNLKLETIFFHLSVLMNRSLPIFLWLFMMFRGCHSVYWVLAVASDFNIGGKHLS